MPRSHQPRQPKPLDAPALEALALRYVGRYATTRAKLRAYLARKLKERGWASDAPPPAEAIIERFVGLGYIDDRAFAEMRGAALSRRGFGKRRIDEALRHAGVSAEDAAEAAGEPDEERDWSAALALARRRRIGPYAAVPEDRDAQRRSLAILLRAGHEYATARRVLAASHEEIGHHQEL